MKIFSIGSLSFVLALCCASAQAGPYVVLRDDGTLTGFSSTTGDPGGLTDAIMALYDASGQPRPDILSIWTSFNFDGNYTETIPLAVSNDVRGINLESVLGGDGTITPTYGPLKTILVHNNIMRMTDRAAFSGAPIDHFAEYLFLLELSHMWGPAVQVPGATPNELIGFTFHWSFWMDAGGSPVGGNRWHDNGDGTFSTLPQTPGGLRYSMLDLYLMGLADPSEVHPFGILENAVPPTTASDPMTKGAYTASSFPRFDPTPISVKATRRSFTIEDIVAKNGTRTPLASASQKAWTLGLVLAVPALATDDEVAKAKAVFDPIAPTLGPAFATATMNRGTISVITSDVPLDAGVPGDAEVSLDGGVTGSSKKGGCELSPPGVSPAVTWLLLSLLSLAMRRRKTLIR